MQELKTAKDLFDLAIGKYQSGNFQEAIEAFRKSITLKEDWNSYNGLGWALLNTSHFQKAIKAFRKSITLKEDWNSYSGLGWTLFNTSQYPQAIDAFHKSLALKKYGKTYQGIGWALFHAGENIEAIEAFRKSITLKEDSNSYNGLGWTLFNTSQYPQAVDAFRKSLALKEDYGTYRGLGLALNNTSQYPQAIDAFHKSLALKEHWNSYRNLGTALHNSNQYPQAIDAFHKSFAINKPIYAIDPYLGNRCIYEKIDKEQLESLKQSCTTFGFDFLPSLSFIDAHLNESWGKLLYIHIPKCGGTSFEQPLHRVKRHLLQMQSSNYKLNRHFCYLNAGRQMTESSEVNALINLISANSCKDIKSIFLTTHNEKCEHNAKWSDLHKHINKTINSSPRVITTVRDPRQRLLSHIKHRVSQDGLSMENLVELIEKKNSILNNTMHKHIFDHGLKDNTCYSLNRNSDYESIENIDFVDISDSSTLSKIKSAFLSISLLPNIVQFSRLNDSKDKEPIKLSAQEIEYAFNLCLDKGFTNKDESIDFTFLKKKTLSRLSFPHFNKESTFLIHPLTFLVSRKSVGSIIPTKEFLLNPLNFLGEN